MLYAIIAIASVLTLFAIMTKNALMGIVGAGGWLGLTYWFNTNLPGVGVAIGTSLFDTIIVVCVGAAIATFIIPILQDNDSDSGFVKRIKRAINHGDYSDDTPKRRRLYDATPEEYSVIVNRAAHPNGNRRRR